VFTGHGQVTMPGRAIQLAPERAAAPGVTHAALVVSARNYGDSLGLYCEDSLARFEAIHIRHRT